jgi:hypothetical protein
MRGRALTLAAVLTVLAPGSALAFSHGDVPNVSSDKRAHEPIKERVKEEEHEGGTYHRPKGAHPSWWDNGGHLHHDAAYTNHGTPPSSEPRSGSGRKAHVQQLSGGATVSDAPPTSRHHSKHP